jgi:hypothetical protein
MPADVNCHRHGANRAVCVCGDLFASLTTREPVGLTWFEGEDGNLQAFCDACWTAEIEEFRRRTATGSRLVCLECLEDIAAVNGTWLFFGGVTSQQDDQPRL